MRPKIDHGFLIRIGIACIVLVAAQGGTYFVLRFFGLSDESFSNVIINAVFLIACIGYIRLFHLLPQDIGLQMDRRRIALHVWLCLAIFLMYVLYYLFGVRVSGLRPLSSATLWGVMNYLVVSCAEEIYFRGIWFYLIEQKYSGIAAVVVSGLLFGFAHIRQGLGALPKVFSGWLWGSARYATGMIFLLIFPVHFAYNSAWLLFEGNWENPSAWLLMLFEILIGGVVIVWSRSRRQLMPRNGGSPARST